MSDETNLGVGGKKNVSLHHRKSRECSRSSCVNMVDMCEGIVYLLSLMVINIFLFPLVTVRGEGALCCWLFARFFSLGCRIPALNALGTTGPKWLVRSREIF